MTVYFEGQGHTKTHSTAALWRGGQEHLKQEREALIPAKRLSGQGLSVRTGIEYEVGHAFLAGDLHYQRAVFAY